MMEGRNGKQQGSRDEGITATMPNRFYHLLFYLSKREKTDNQCERGNKGREEIETFFLFFFPEDVAILGEYISFLLVVLLDCFFTDVDFL